MENAALWILGAIAVCALVYWIDVGSSRMHMRQAVREHLDMVGAAPSSSLRPTRKPAHNPIARCSSTYEGSAAPCREWCGKLSCLTNESTATALVPLSVVREMSRLGVGAKFDASLSVVGCRCTACGAEAVVDTQLVHRDVCPAVWARNYLSSKDANQ